MKFYLSLNSLPELDGYAKPQKRLLWKQALKANRKNKQVWLGYAILYLGVITAILLFPKLDSLWMGMLMGAITGGIIGLISNSIIIAALRPTLAHYRREREQVQNQHDDDYFVPHAF
ncbi:hypothetical protein [Herpetosiphon geysericola]|uniref:Uncharacterized protein n=1 Tax=Herpetosiphon geysericola TaxID=70996 RepID=A0A0P6Y355_9CHLR|nr:hypothetical protein [Herpetosiphon geysericola]KPL90281.1 hypothetical protein SE18_06545 [Herpetosiphon geysericola]